MDIRIFDQSGATNEYLGLLFTIRKHGDRYILDFLVKGLPLKSGVPLSIKMYPERNHRRPHIHVYKGSKETASVALDGDFLAGGKTISSKEKSYLLSWIADNRNALHELWSAVNQGTDYDIVLSQIQGQWQYRETTFEGTKPEKETTVEGVHLWYNGELSSTPQEDGTIKIMCTNDVCAYVPKESEAYGKTILFECSRYQCKTEA